MKSSNKTLLYQICETQATPPLQQGSNLGDGSVREVGVGSGRASEDVKDQWVVWVSHHAGQKMNYQVLGKLQSQNSF